MAPVIIAAVGAQSALGIFAATTFGSFVISTAISVGLSFVSRALAPKPKKPKSRGVTQLVRASSEPHKIIWGERIVSGVVTFISTTHSSSGGSPTGDNRYLHMIVALAGHQCNKIGTVFLNDVGVDDSDMDGDGVVTTGRFANKLIIKKHLGEDDQAAEDAMITGIASTPTPVAEWTVKHQLKNITYLYVRMEFSAEVFPTGIPNVKALVQGRLVADPRDTAISITSSSVAAESVLTTGSVHGLVAGDRFFMTNHSGSVPTLAGEYYVLSVPTTSSITIGVNVTTGGTGGTLLQMKYSDNAALCARDYLLAGFGVAADQTDEIDDVAAVAAADVCDEEVNYPVSGLMWDADDSTLMFDPADDYFYTQISPVEFNFMDFTADATTDILTQTVAVTDPVTKPKPLHPGDGVEFTTTGTLPAGLELATRYFVFDVGGKGTPFTFQVASSLVNARASVTINVTDAGTGTHTLQRISQPRYTTNGLVFLDNAPIDIIPELIVTMGGSMSYTQGRYTMFPGAYNGPASVTLTEDDLRGEISIRPRPGKADIHNAVQGTFSDRDSNFLPTDFPPVINSTFVASDLGEKIFKDVTYDFVTEVRRAQRLARLTNQRDRQGLIIEVQCKLTALRLAVGDVVDVSIDRMGWASKEFEVMNWTLQENGGINLILQETASGVYAFDPDVDTSTEDLTPNTNLPSAFDAPPTVVGLALASGTTELFAQADGTVVSRIKATWTAVNDIAVTEGGRIEIQLKKNADTVWDTFEMVLGDQAQHWIAPVLDGTSYDVRVRALNRLRVPSAAWDTVSAHTVVGKTAAPTDVSGLSLSEEAGGIRVTWSSIADADLRHYEIRTGNVVWASATPLAFAKTNNFLDTRELTATTLYYKVKAIDTSGIESATAAAASVIVAVPAAPTSLVLASSTEHLLNDSGDIIPRILVTWVDSASTLTDKHFVSWKKGTESLYDTRVAVNNGVQRFYITGVEAGTNYDVQVFAQSQFGLDGTVVSSLAHTVIGKTAAPANVTGLALAEEAGGIRLTWTQVADVDLAQYEIRGITNVVWGSSTNIAFVKGTSYLYDRTIVAATTYFKVKAVDTSGNESATSNDANIVVAAPVAPTGLVLNSGNTHVVKPSSGEVIARIQVVYNAVAETLVDKYEIQWKLSSAGSYEDTVLVDGGILSWYISGVETGTNYDVRVRAVTQFGLAGTFATVSAHNVGGKSDAPTNVSGLALTLEQGGVRLKWTAIADADLRHYEIRTGNVIWSSAVHLAFVKTDNFLDVVGGAGTNYYKVKAVDTSGNESATSNDANVVITVPSTPGTPVAASGTSQLLLTGSGEVIDRILFTWTASTPDTGLTLVSYEIQSKKNADGSWEINNLIDASLLRHFIAPVESGTSWDMRVRAIDNWGLKSAWATVSAHTVIGKSAVPTNVSGIALTLEQGGVRVKWTDIADADLRHYEIRTGNSIWSSAVHLAFVKTNNFLDLVRGAGTHYYKIKAIDTSGNESATSNDANTVVTVPSTPGSPTAASGTTHLLVNASGDIIDRIFFEWTASTPDTGLSIVSYEVEARLNGATPWSNNFKVGTAIVDQYISPVNAGDGWDIRVRSIDNWGLESAYATVTNHTVVGKSAAPANVAGFTATRGKGTELLSWDAVADVDLSHYEIRTGSATWASAAFKANVKGTSYVRDVLTSGTTINVIKAIDTSGNESATAAQADSVITAPGTPTLGHHFDGENFMLTIATTPGSYPVVSHEIRRGGASWAAATLVAIIDTNLFIDFVDWGGAVTWRVKATDTFGNIGAEATEVVTVTIAETSGLAATVSHDTVTLAWTNDVGSVPVANVEVRRGATFGAATSLALAKMSAQTLTGEVAGSNTYWVRITDTAGNNGTEDSVVASVLSGPGRLVSFQTFTATGTWTRPSNVTHVMVEVVGAGGGGGGSSNVDDRIGGTGGGGGYSKELIDVSALATASVTVGTGGTAGSITGPGGVGNTSDFGTGPLVQATGGAGGIEGNNTVTQAAGGVGSLGDINLTGQVGQRNGVASTSEHYSSGASAGGYGNSTTASQRDTVGESAKVYGNGGGGGYRVSSTSRAGGTGSAGIVVVTEYE